LMWHQQPGFVRSLYQPPEEAPPKPNPYSYISILACSTEQSRRT
jgi:hypothetical protein